MVVLPAPGTPASAMRIRRLGSDAWRAKKCSTRVRSVSTIVSRSHDSACPDILPDCRTFPVIDKLRTLGSLQSARGPAILFYLAPWTRTSVVAACADISGPLVVSTAPKKTASITAVDGTTAWWEHRVDFPGDGNQCPVGFGTGNPTVEAFQESSVCGALLPWFGCGLRALLGGLRGGDDTRDWRGRLSSGGTGSAIVQ